MSQKQNATEGKPSVVNSKSPTRVDTKQAAKEHDLLETNQKLSKNNFEEADADKEGERGRST